MLAWATATFWFPLMVAIGVWRHIVRRLPLRYHPSYWALVFPLDMYGAATDTTGGPWGRGVFGVFAGQSADDGSTVKAHGLRVDDLRQFRHDLPQFVTTIGHGTPPGV